MLVGDAGTKNSRITRYHFLCCNRSSTEPNTVGFAHELEYRKPLR
jgi:hypothetical protein